MKGGGAAESSIGLVDAGHWTGLGWALGWLMLSVDLAEVGHWPGSNENKGFFEWTGPNRCVSVDRSMFKMLNLRWVQAKDWESVDRWLPKMLNLRWAQAKAFLS